MKHRKFSWIIFDTSKHKRIQPFFKSNVSSIDILLETGFMSNDVRTFQRGALPRLRWNRETALTNEVSASSSSVPVPRRGGDQQGSGTLSRDKQLEISSIWRRQKALHLHILYCQFNFHEVNRTVRVKFIPNLNLFAGTVWLVIKSNQLSLCSDLIYVVDFLAFTDWNYL